MDTTEEDVLYDSAVNSSVQMHLGMFDFVKMQADVLADARSTATDFGVDENHAVEFVTEKLGETFVSIRAEIAERVANEVELARNQARVIRQDYFDKLEALIDGVEAEFVRVRSELTASELDLSKFPELAQYAEHMKRIGDEGAERMIGVVALATNQFARLLRLKFRNELKFVFSKVFIGEKEIAQLIDFYAGTLPEVNLAA
jgi:hypothetical protein